jgi:hypothetical protein
VQLSNRLFVLQNLTSRRFDRTVSIWDFDFYSASK